MEDILEKLTDYVIALKEAEETHAVANERDAITKHLSQAAKIYALLHRHSDPSAIEGLVKSEIRNHGWSYISGSSGDKIADTWVSFTKESGITYT